jgi:hypothetical protein
MSVCLQTAREARLHQEEQLPDLTAHPVEERREYLLLIRQGDEVRGQKSPCFGRPVVRGWRGSTHEEKRALERKFWRENAVKRSIEKIAACSIFFTINQYLRNYPNPQNDAQQSTQINTHQP